MDNENVLIRAQLVLDNFQKAMQSEYDLAADMNETAKKLYKDLHYKINNGKLRVEHGELTVDEFETLAEALWEQQSTLWSRFMDKAVEEKGKVEAIYQPVRDIECLFKPRKRDEGNEGWMALPPSEQEAVRKAYHHGWKRNFHDAKAEVDALISYPDGYFTQIELLYRKASRKKSDAFENLRVRKLLTGVDNFPTAVVH